MKKKKINPMPLDEAVKLAKEEYPERYESYGDEGMVDVNKFRRAMYVRKLVKEGK